MKVITSPLILPTDVILVPVDELPDQVRENLEYEDGDYAITRPLSRTPSRIIDSRAAVLLQEFRTAKTIVEAIISYSQGTKTDPEEVLEEAFPMIQRLLNSRILVLADSQEADQIIRSFERGDRFAGFTILNCIQILEDTELYHVKSFNGEEAVLKILRPSVAYEQQQMLEREAAILKYLDGKVNPKLLAEGTFKERPYLIIEWCVGAYSTTIAEEARRLSGIEDRKRILELCCSILEAYSHLHVQGIIHSDVHPRNILIAGDGSVSVIDYGLARWENEDGKLVTAQRGGVGFFFEPEYATACMAKVKPPESSFLGEQYALAVMLYFLFTGTHYLDFSLEKNEMMRQIAEDRMLPFFKRGIKSWPVVEKLLEKALSKEPSDRFPSISEFAARLRQVVTADELIRLPIMRNPSTTSNTPVDELLREVLYSVGSSGPLFLSGVTTPPICSVNYGASGIAYALYRIACVRNDATLLSLADVWSTRAAQQITNNTAFINAEIDITPEVVGKISPYHTISGVYCVQALIGHAMGDVLSQQEAIESFLLAVAAPCENLDLTLGRSGVLLACSLLLDTMPDSKTLHHFGNVMMQGIWNEINAFAPIEECSEISYLGVAHGWAGILYAIISWCQSSKSALPDSLEERLQQLVALSEHKERGVHWKVYGNRKRKHEESYMSGWCHGSAGYVHLWTLAYRMLCNKTYFTLAQKAAWNAWEEPDLIGNLCCGLAGRAYGLLNFYKLTGEKEWLQRAQQLSNKAALSVKNGNLQTNSLYKGEIGIAALSADLSRPEESCMPLFEKEGWHNY